MVKAKFEEVVFFQEGPGVRNWQFRDSGIKLINIRNIVGDKLCLDNTSNYLDEDEVEQKYKHFLLNKGDFVMASSGVTWGKIAEIDEKHLPLCLNTSIIRLLPKQDKILDKWYLYYFIKSPQFRRQIERLITGSAQPNFGPSHLKKVFINITELDEQKSVVNKLRSVENIIMDRKNQLSKLDELIKARFVELFGRQSHNEKNLPYLTIDDVAEIYLGITHTPTYVDEGVMFISAKNTSGDVLDLSDVKYISREEFESAPKGSKPQKNDVLFSRVGSNLGHPVILEDNLELCTFVSLGFLRTKGSVTSNYLKHWMRDDFFATQVKAHVKGGGQPNLNTGWLKQFKIIVPDIESQIEFDNFCEQVDKSKVVWQKAINIINYK